MFILYTSALFGQGMANILKGHRGLQVEGLANCDKKGWKQVRSSQPDLVIIEGQSPVGDAARVLQGLLKRSPQARVIIVDLDRRDAVMFVALKVAATESNLVRAAKCKIHCNKIKQTIRRIRATHIARTQEGQ